MKKLFFGILVAGSITFPMQASAGSLGNNLGFNIVEVTETAVRKNADKILTELWKSAVLMEESKICIAEALEMNPREIAASKEILQAMIFDHKDLNAIRRSINHQFLESEMQEKIAELMTITDQTKLDQLTKLLQRSKDVRSLARHYSSHITGRFSNAIGHLAVMNEMNPAEEDRIAGYFFAQIEDSDEMLKYQVKQMKIFDQTFNAIEKKLNIETPSRKELKQIEREILPK